MLLLARGGRLCGLARPLARRSSDGRRNSEHHEMASRRAHELGVGVATLTPRCLLKGESGLTVGSKTRLAGGSDRADAGGVDSKLSPVPKRKAIANDLYPACVGHGDGKVHVGRAHIASDPSASLLADPGANSLEREGAGGKGAGGGTGCSMVAERVKQTAAGAEPGRERQRDAQAAEEEHSELFFFTGLFPWHESDGPAARFSGASYTLQASTGRVAAGGSALLRQQGRARVPALGPTVGSRGGARAKLTRGPCS